MDIKPTTDIAVRSERAAYLDIDDDVTLTFGDAWRTDWRSSALEAIDHLAERLDWLRREVAEGMHRPGCTLRADHTAECHGAPVAARS